MSPNWTRLARAGTVFARVVFEDVIAALFPGACRSCGATLPEPGAAGTVPRWSRPLRDGSLRRALLGPLSVPLWFLCVRCAERLRPSPTSGRLRRPPVQCVTAFLPTPQLFDLVHALKYESFRELAPWLGERLAVAARATLGRNLVLVPVPLHPLRQRERGFNQSALLARRAAARLGCTVAENLVERCRATSPQARLEHVERTWNVAGAFARRVPLPGGDARLVVVDDVITTGATVAAVLAALGAEPHSTAVLALCVAGDALCAGPATAAAVRSETVPDGCDRPGIAGTASALPENGRLC